MPLNPLLNNFLMRDALANCLPGSQFIRGVYKSPVPAQVARFTRAELQHARRNNILRGSNIAVMFASALRARPLSDIESQLIEPMSAAGTSLRARKPPVHRDHGTAKPCGLVGEHTAELSESRVGNMLSEPRVFDHAFNVQIFDADNLVLTYKPSGKRVHFITTLIRNPAMYTRHAQALPLAARRSFLPTTQTSLLLLKVTQPFYKFSRILDLLAVTEGRQMRQSKIDPDHRSRHRQQINFNHGTECGVVAPVWLALEGDRTRTRDRRKTLGEIYNSKLRQAHDTVYPLRFAHILKPQRHGIVMARPETRVSRRLASLYTPEKMNVSRIKITQNLYQTGSRWFSEPLKTRQRLKFCEAAGNINSGDGFLASLVCLLAVIKRPVPKPAGRTEPLVKHPNLRPIGVGANTVTSLYGGHAQIITRG